MQQMTWEILNRDKTNSDLLILKALSRDLPIWLVLLYAKVHSLLPHEFIDICIGMNNPRLLHSECVVSCTLGFLPKILKLEKESCIVYQKNVTKSLVRGIWFLRISWLDSTF